MTESAPLNVTDALALLAQREAELAQLRTSHEGLLRAVAHDLRAPLRHVTSFMPLLLESVETLSASAGATAQAQEAAEEAREFAATMAQSAQRMARMLDGMALLSRAVRAPLVPQPVEWGALCREVLRPLQARYPQLQVQWQLPAAVWLQADADALRSVAQALLDNAAKFSVPVPAPQLTLRAQPVSTGGWCLQVQDNGVGFDDTRAQQLFALFQRMHRESEFDGVGVGLAVVQAMAQRHGADVRMSARPGLGCTVVLEWPAAAAPAEASS